MNILFAASEAVPLAKTGGLADVAGALPKAMNELGVNVSVMLPKYEQIPVVFSSQFERIAEFTVSFGWRNQYCGLLKAEIDNVTYDTGAADDTGTRTLSLTIELQPPGRSARGQTLVKRSLAEQQFDNDETDTGLEYVATVGTIPEEWGQVSR